ncbi:MAG: phosphatase PAP2 family protein [Dehalococcoidales bacterium]|nr:phosphatase PAP2 family protein [Dehalococcoidales bacterium]
MLDQIRRNEIAFGVLAVASLVLAWLAHYYTRFPGDLQVTLALQTFQNRLFLAVMEGISYVIDNWKGIIVVVIAAFIFWRAIGVLEGSMILLAGLFTGANEILKIIVNRPRPTADLIQVFVVESEKTFPSGHAFFAVAVLGFIAYLIATRQSKLYQKALTASVCVLFILLVGVSRIFLGAHWASDVIGGYVFGSAFLVAEVWIYKRFTSRFS